MDVTTGAMPSTPQIVTMGCRSSSRGEVWDWHIHPFDEICFVAEDSTTIGHGGRKAKADPNTLYLFRHGERHGFWNAPNESPDLWVIHFAVADGFFAGLPDLVRAEPRSRIWQLGQAEVREFRSLFVNMTLEAARPTSDAAVLSSAWLQLLLGALQRWRLPNESKHLVTTGADPDVLELWKIVNDSVTTPFADLDRLPEIMPNYDSLRHRFRRAFGLSPRAMMHKLRMQRAQHLLLEGRMSIKEIATSVGYWRQHEFARAFRREVGVAPSDYRRRPRLNVERQLFSESAK